MRNILSEPERKRRAGHQEILGETLAKFEFFQHGWHPYSRFLDVDRVDLLLRRRRGAFTDYREIQVKFGKLYRCTREWEKIFFYLTSWRFFTEKNLSDLTERYGLYLAYILSEEDSYRSDMFIFPAQIFADVVRRSDRLTNGNYRLYISKTNQQPARWYARRLPKFDKLDETTVIDVTPYYRNFDCL